MNEIERLAAGVIAVGFDGLEIEPQVRARLQHLPLAGLILFARNIESVAQTRALTDDIRALLSADGVPPFVAIDQEGGRVARLRQDVEELPSMMALSATGDESLAEEAGEQLAFDLRRAGVNVDYAPVLDLAVYRANTVIGARSFGDDPERVTQMAGAFARGLERGGIVATFKHFPGHGSTAVDSHLDLPAIDEDEAAIRARDLVPFERLLPHARALMTAHIVFRSLDAERPATLSPRILTGLLRDELGFEGVAFTDCMQMEAIASSVGTAAGAAAAIAAGADCVLISHSLDLAEDAVRAIARGVESGQIPRERLEEAFARVRTLRKQLAAPLDISAPAPYSGVGVTIGARAVTSIRGDAHVDPAHALVVTFEGTTIEGVQGLHAQHTSLRAYVPGISELQLPLEPTQDHIAKVEDRVRSAAGAVVVLMRRAHIYTEQQRAVERLLEIAPNAVLVSTREPFDAFLFPQARHVLCTYGDDAPSIAGLAQVLFGDVEPAGRMPLEIHAIR